MICETGRIVALTMNEDTESWAHQRFNPHKVPQKTQRNEVWNLSNNTAGSCSVLSYMETAGRTRSPANKNQHYFSNRDQSAQMWVCKMGEIAL